MKMILLTLALVLIAPQAYAEKTRAPNFTLTDASGKQITLPRKHDGVDKEGGAASACMGSTDSSRYRSNTARNKK